MPTATTTENHTALATTVLEKLEQAWNAADGAAFGALFAEESDFVNVRGEHHRGSAQIGRGHQGIFDTIYAGSTVRYRLDLGVSPEQVGSLGEPSGRGLVAEG